MPPKIEKLDVKNIIEIAGIRKVLKKHPDLLSMFEIILIMCNNRLNEEEPSTTYAESESEEEPVLSDHESDLESEEEDPL